MAPIGKEQATGGLDSPTAEASVVQPVLSQVRDAESYRGAVAGADVEAVRTGPGRGSNRVLAVTTEEVAVTVSSIGFPIRTRSTIADGRLLFIVVRSAPPGSRFCEIDLRQGQLLAYGPGVEHHGSNKVGLGFVFAALSQDALQARAEQLGIGLDLPARGEASELHPSQKLEAPSYELEMMAGQSATRPIPTWQLDQLLTSLAMGFESLDRVPSRRRDARRLDSRRIVEAGAELATSIGHPPAIHELCVATNVSERRLREAFVSVYGVPPTVFFRDTMLATAHQRLVSGTPASDTVGGIAADLGFDHAGRFARRYQQVYGEFPSVTLRTRF